MAKKYKSRKTRRSRSKKGGRNPILGHETYVIQTKVRHLGLKSQTNAISLGPRILKPENLKSEHAKNRIVECSVFSTFPFLDVRILAFHSLVNFPL